MKRKTLTLILCLLTVMSLVGVGFASWVISAGDSETVGGNIVVDTVVDQRYTLVVTKPGDENIILAAPSEANTATATNKWLTSDIAKGAAKTTVTYTCKVTKNDGTAFTEVINNEGNLDSEERIISDLRIDMNFSATVDEGKTDLQDSIDKKIIEYISDDGCSYHQFQLSADKKTITFMVTFGFDWGELFDYMVEETPHTDVNPFEFYNRQEANDLCGEDVYAVDASGNIGDLISDEVATWADHAYYYLTILSKIDASAKYSATISVSKPAQGELGTYIMTAGNNI